MKLKIDKYLELTKPKVTLLNLLVGIACFVLATFPLINWFKIALFCVAGYLAAGGCGALNCVYDGKIDRLMQRTSKRAIPSGAVSAKNALIFGMALTVAGLAIVYFFFSVLTVILIFTGLVFYLPIYTVLLKRASPWNVVIGGAAGCFAALAGWTATGATITWIPVLIASIDFFWTPGHLWGLAIKKVKEYQKAGIPMLPVTAGIRRASKIVFWINVLTVAFSFLLPMLNLAGILYLAVAAMAGMGFLSQSRKLLVSPSEAQGFKVFLFSMPYLTCLMLGLIIDKIVFI
ncbi:MAG: heme o synthase [Candidatus Bathyarchaeia archaeon]|jgi:protoheme IX farnesyltransferase